MTQNATSGPSEEKTFWKSISAFFNAIFRRLMQLANRFKNWMTKTKPEEIIAKSSPETVAEKLVGSTSAAAPSTATTAITPQTATSSPPPQYTESFERIEVVAPTIQFDKASIKTYIENLDKSRKALDSAWHEDTNRTKYLEKTLFYPSIMPSLAEAKKLIEQSQQQYSLTDTEVKKVVELNEDFNEKLSVVESVRKTLEAEAASKGPKPL